MSEAEELIKYVDGMIVRVKKAINELIEDSFQDAINELNNIETSCSVCKTYINEGISNIETATTRCTINGKEVDCKEAKKKALEILTTFSENLEKTKQSILEEGV